MSRKKTTVAQERRLREESEQECRELQQELTRLRGLASRSATPAARPATPAAHTVAPEYPPVTHPLKPPTFEGKSEVRDFLETFDRVARHNHWDEEEAGLQLCLSLRGHAAENTQKKSYQELREYLVARYGLTQDEARRALRVAKLQKGDSIFDFGHHLLQLVETAHPHLSADAKEELATQELVEALGDWALRREFRLQPAETYAEALKRVQEYNFDRAGAHVRYMGTSSEKEDTKSDLEKRVAALEVSQAALSDKIDHGHSRSCRSYASRGGQQKSSALL